MPNNEENQQVFRIACDDGWVSVRVPKETSSATVHVLRKLADLIDLQDPFSKVAQQMEKQK